jgi:hypothetical protein
VNRFLICCISLAALSWPAKGQKVEVQKLDRARILHVQTALNHLTVLEMNEPVSAVAVGSTVFKVEWRENKVFIEPTEENVATNLFVWTGTSRFNYELDPAGSVPQMHFAVDQPPAASPLAKSSANRPPVTPKAPSPADVLTESRPVWVHGAIPSDKRVAVYLRSLFEQEGKLFIQYSIRNESNAAYTPGIPQVIALDAPHYRESLYTLRNCQLSPNEASRLKSRGQTVIQVASNQMVPSPIVPSHEATGIVVVKLPQSNTEPIVLRLVFPSSSSGPISATLVL